MTNKLKKEIEKALKKLDINSDWFYKQKSYLAGFTQVLLKKAIKQAKLSQKQEDVKRFEEFIEGLKEEIVYPCTKDEIYDIIDKLAGADLI